MQSVQVKGLNAPCMTYHCQSYAMAEHEQFVVLKRWDWH